MRVSLQLPPFTIVDTTLHANRCASRSFLSHSPSLHIQSVCGRANDCLLPSAQGFDAALHALKGSQRAGVPASVSCTLHSADSPSTNEFHCPALVIIGSVPLRSSYPASTEGIILTILPAGLLCCREDLTTPREQLEAVVRVHHGKLPRRIQTGLDGGLGWMGSDGDDGKGGADYSISGMS